MQQAVEMMYTYNLTPASIAVTAWQAWLWLKCGDLDAVEQWAQEMELTLQEEPGFTLEFEHMTLARVWMAQGRLDEAQQLLARLLAAANNAGRSGRVITICVLRALAARLQGSTDEALKPLAHALSLGEPEGYVRVFLDEGAPMAALLREARARGISIDYVTRLLAAFDRDVPPASTAPSRRSSSDDIEPLSGRELEVLRLIAEGASNREIAEQLVISVGTVKKHLNNIFLKLDAHSRTQVIAVARQQNLL
jgi:LuxR family maltose regulon positive regulatory protein